MQINYNKHIFKTFEEQVEKNPDKTAVIFENKIWTYRELNENANLIANELISMAVGPGEIIAIFMERTVSLLAIILGIMKSGNVYVPLDPENPIDRIKKILEDVAPVLVITQQNLNWKLHQNYKTYIPDYQLLRSKNGILENPEIEIDPSSLAYIIFTSGSTGRPKGVMISHSSVNNLIYSMAAKPGITSEDRLLAVAAVSFDMSVPDLFLPLISGASIILLNKEGVHDPSVITMMLEKYQCTIMQATPVTWRMLIDYGWRGDKNLKALCGGEALSTELAEEMLQFCGELWNMYGPTETTVWSTLDKVQKEKPVSIGCPIHNTEIYILDYNMQEVTNGEIGDLFIGGIGLAKGYYKRQDLTTKAFLPNPFNLEERIYKTGDLARIMSDGRLECLGRSDFQVKIRGFRVELGEIENTLIKMDKIKSILINAQNVHKNQKDLVAYIIPENEPIEHSEIRQFLSEKLPDYMIPSYSINIDKFPLNINKKIDRKALPIPSVSISGSILEPPLDGLNVKEKLQQVWKTVLHQQSIQPEDNFFDYGGNSILAVQCVTEINRLCGSDLSLGMFFKHPRITELTDIIEGRFQYDTGMVVPLQKNGDQLPLFCIAGIALYSELAKSLGNDRPVYGMFLSNEQQLIEDIQNNAPKNRDYLTIERAASNYLNEIKKIQVNGPYNLLGFSGAGIIAFEIARQLKSAGEEISSLFILDSHLPSGMNMNIKGKVINFIRNIRNKFVEILQKPTKKMDKGRLSPTYIAKVRDKVNSKATKQYDKIIPLYHGDACLIRAVDNQYPRGMTYSYDLGWKNVTIGKLDIFDIHGQHLEILMHPNVGSLADKIYRYIKKQVLD